MSTTAEAVIQNADALEGAWREIQSRFRYAMMMRERATTGRMSWWERRRARETYGKDADLAGIVAGHWEREVEDLSAMLKAIDVIRVAAKREVQR